MPSLPHIPNPFSVLTHLGSIATSAESMARDTAVLGDLHDRLAAIEGHLSSVDHEVALMRHRVDVMGNDVVALQRLEDQLADVSASIAPLRRLGGRSAKRRLPDAPAAGAPDAA